MKKYITDRSKQMKNRILAKARVEFGNVNTYIFWQNGSWWIKVIISKEDIIEYDVIINDENEIDFMLK